MFFSRWTRNASCMLHSKNKNLHGSLISTSKTLTSIFRFVHKSGLFCPLRHKLFRELASNLCQFKFFYTITRLGEGMKEEVLNDLCKTLTIIVQENYRESTQKSCKQCELLSFVETFGSFLICPTTNFFFEYSVKQL